MSRVHDMGGRFGDPEVEPEPQGIPQFAADWHGRALALTIAAGAHGKWNIDMSRHARECLAPKDYTRFSYYEKWLAGLADILVQTGVLKPEDLLEEGQSEQHHLAARTLTKNNVAAALAKGGPANREGGPKPAFAVGQPVRTRRLAENALNNGGHTRLPDYASDARGQILRLHGTHVLPDSSAHQQGDAPEPLYAVVFDASELWAFPEHPKDKVVLDLWQSYLVPE